MGLHHFFHAAGALAITPWAAAEYYGTPLWVWICLPFLVGVAFLLAKLAGRVADSVIRRGEPRAARLVGLLRAVRTPAEFAFGVWIFKIGRSFMPMAENTKVFLGYCELAAWTVVGIWLLVRLTSFGCDRLASFFDRSGRSHAKAVIPLLRKVVKTAVVLFGLIFLLQNFDVDVGAMLAGLGIGGLALALASKKTVEDLFAGATLVVDQPARVGDVCKYGNSTGTVEDIGLRSTRIRTPERTLITIPNSKFSEMEIENLAYRDRILLKTTIGISYDNSPQQMRAILAGIRQMLAKRDDIAEGARVRFIAITESALQIEIFAYVKTRDFNLFLEVREKVFLGIMDIVTGEGAGFASPSPPVVLERDSKSLQPA
ncbi:mechanosensitive ion channel family protein [Luteolibacter sp. GHJ8]|uniref:Mechanosensitive ion channel family protein n=1 Tax=Luteolibacter rhizosphaerae TaxID=2989719 RepID=A0ABT3G5Z0_9BACT|nr:mechanosensitive ion channel family protein [Luteolibacter rhizosphaerae]MCW1915240.1 mechanosensitive ion channel family protein [Luteolibacter rhizosphaerae]